MTASLFPPNFPSCPRSGEESSPQKCCYDEALLSTHLLQGRTVKHEPPFQTQSSLEKYPPGPAVRYKSLFLRGCHSGVKVILEKWDIWKKIIEGFSQSRNMELPYSKKVCRSEISLEVQGELTSI